MKHIPVMLDEAMEGLKIREDGVYVDGTYGAGGHSSEILNRLTIGVLYGFDRDLSVLVAAKSDRRLRLRHNNFSDMADVLRADGRSEEHTSELQSRGHLVCRLLLEKKKNTEA